MDVLHAQFNSGPLSLEEIKTVLGSDFGTSWPTIQKKFKQTDAGLFFNERLEAEKVKRKTFTESRRKNLAKAKKSHMEPHMDSHMANHMEPHMENENRNNVIVSKVGELKKSLLSDYLIEDMASRVRGFSKQQFEFAIDDFLTGIAVNPHEINRTTGEIKSHFTNWCRNNEAKIKAKDFQIKPIVKPKPYDPHAENF